MVMAESLLSELLESWELILRAENKSPLTISSYLRGVRLYLGWCEQNGHPVEVTRTQVRDYMAELIAEGKEANTVRLRQASLRQFVAWLVEEGELPDNPLLGLKTPKIPAKVVHALSDDQLRALIKACKGPSFRDKRDEAIVRLMSDTGMRAAETLALTVADVQPLKDGIVTIHSGKGMKGRRAPFGAQTAASLDRYLRLRRSHRYAETPALWLGSHGKGFAYFGLNDSLKDRAKSAGIEGFHLHKLRHTFATRWKAARGSDDALMSIAGWSNRSMIDRYAGAAAADRAAQEARALNLGDL